MLNIELWFGLMKIPNSRANLLNEAKRIINLEKYFMIKKDSSLIVCLGQSAFGGIYCCGTITRPRDQYEVLILL